MGYNVQVLAGDQKTKNVTGNNYVPSQQVAAVGVKLFCVTVFVMSAAATDGVLWLFDLAAGSGASANPDVVLACPKGLTTKLEFDGGARFFNGLYAVLASNEPADATSTPTAMANNSGIIRCEIRNLN